MMFNTDVCLMFQKKTDDALKNLWGIEDHRRLLVWVFCSFFHIELVLAPHCLILLISLFYYTPKHFDVESMRMMMNVFQQC